MPIPLETRDALVIVDVQKDFLPGGALAVPDGDAVIPALNRYIALCRERNVPVFATRDWHPGNHCSFKAQGGPWPPHCIAFSPGAAFATDLQLPSDARIVSKAQAPERDAYSGFEGTELEALLRARGASRLLVGGLATDYCVLNTVRDALARGFQVLLLKDAIRAVNVQPGDGDKAEGQMLALGARLITLRDLEP
jgi:nicotinamidase/pyrazinamidase